MSDAVDAALADLADEVVPTDAERAAMWAAVDALTDRVVAAIDDLGLDAEALHVGSTARGTWLAGERDIDLFVRFPAGIDRQTLADDGLAVGRAVLDDAEANYAEHPYIAGTYNGFDVDIVPCVAVPDASEAETAVDRTPFHNAYVSERLNDDLATDIRVAKRMLSKINAYGSDLRTRGFGGYLLELLVLEHDGIRPLFEAIAKWRPPVRLDPADHGSRAFDDPLVVIDPTDPTRNVAAVTAPEQLARAQHYARRFLDEPSPGSFAPPEHAPISAAGLSTELEDRGTHPIALVFDRPDLIDDQLWPQLRKTRGGLNDELDRRGFDVVRSAILTTDARIAILVECGVAKLPRIERHEGPPLAFDEHAERFFQTYVDTEVYGPFIEGDRYVVERERNHRTPRSVLASDTLFDVRLGDQLVEVLEEDYDVIAGEELAELLPEFAEQLAAFFEPAP